MWNFPSFTASTTSGRSIRFRKLERHTLLSRESFEPTDVVETFDLVIDTADGLDFAVLIDRASDGDSLLDGHFRQTREDSIELRGRSAVTVHTIVGLLEANTAGKR